jgi:hypothetical protein
MDFHLLCAAAYRGTTWRISFYMIGFCDEQNREIIGMRLRPRPLRSRECRLLLGPAAGLVFVKVSQERAFIAHAAAVRSLLIKTRFAADTMRRTGDGGALTSAALPGHHLLLSGVRTILPEAVRPPQR